MIPVFGVLYFLNKLCLSLPPKYRATLLTKDSLPSDVGETNLVTPTATTAEATPSLTTSRPSRQHPFMARVLSNGRVTPPDHFQDVRLVAVDIRGSGIQSVF